MRKKKIFPRHRKRKKIWMISPHPCSAAGRNALPTAKRAPTRNDMPDGASFRRCLFMTLAISDDTELTFITSRYSIIALL